MTEIEYGDPLLRRRPRLSDRSGFRTVQLNTAGWSTLVGAGSVVGGAAARLLRAPLIAGLAGGLLGAWAVARGLDHRRWLNTHVCMSSDDVSDQAWTDLVRRLNDDGISVSYEETVDEDTGEIRPGIRCRQTDADAVRGLARSRCG